MAKVVQDACPSKNINAWKLRIGKKCYLVTPAHVLIYGKEGVWTFSKFADDFRNLKWRIPKMYVGEKDENLEFDFAWAEIPDDKKSLDLSDSFETPIKVNFYFRQPYDLKGKWVESSFASIESILYKSPNSDLLEGLDIGFRGMSGAIAVDSDNGKVTGILVRRGGSIAIKEKVYFAFDAITTEECEEQLQGSNETITTGKSEKEFRKSAETATTEKTVEESARSIHDSDNNKTVEEPQKPIRSKHDSDNNTQVMHEISKITTEIAKLDTKMNEGIFTFHFRICQIGYENERRYIYFSF